MKRLKFLETKRTPRYSMRKLNVGMASILLGVTIFGINFTNHSVKAAATTESVETNTQKKISATEKGQQNGATGKVQQSSGSNNATNSTGAVTTSQSAPKMQGSADTDINSSAAKSAATSLVAMQSNKPAKENQVVTEDKINWAAIKYKISDDDNSRGVEITGWDITKGGYDVVLPNTADFVKRGTITEKQAAYVSGDDLHNIFLTLASKTNNPDGKDFTITISHNKDSKLSDSRLHVKPIYYYQNIGYKGHLTSAFGTYSEHNNGTDTHYQNNLTKADLANLDVSNVYDMSNMFWNAAKLKKVDLTGWQTNSVHDFDSMFFGSGIKNLDLSTWNVSNVTNFSYMFANTKNLNVLNISGWKLNKTIEFNGNPGVSGLFLFGKGADNSSVRTIIANDTDLNGHYLQAFKQSHPMEIISNTDKPIFIKHAFVIKDPTDPSSIGSPNFVYVIFVDKQTGEIITKDPYAQVKRPVRDAADQLQAFKDAIRASYDKPLKANDKSLKAKGYEIVDEKVDEKAFEVVDGKMDSNKEAKLATELDKLVDNYYDSSKNPTIMWKVYLSHKKTTVHPNNVPKGMNKDDFVKTVKRVINITDPQTNQTKTITQEVTFTRLGFLDEVTKGLTYGNWSEDGKHTFDKIDVPTIPGYTPSQETINSLVVTPDTDSTTVNITYSKNSAVTVPINPSDNNSNNSNTAPTDNDSKPTDETGEKANIRPLASKKPNNSRSQKESKSKTKATGIKNSSTDNSKPNNGKSIADPMTGQKENGLTGVAQAATTGAKAGQTNSNKLPQTGEKKGMLLSIIGLLAAALGIFGIAINRKKEN
ncbi:mucin-binding protein [Lactobacillus crispatus]|uniref:mucin-binding protein n=1 Tax=Lactobacillus crispatus TaxID=47770 RepID=UPI003F232998